VYLNINEFCHVYMCIFDTLYELFICVLRHHGVLPWIYVYYWYFIWIIQMYYQMSLSLAMNICVLLLLYMNYSYVYLNINESYHEYMCNVDTLYELFMSVLERQWVLPCIYVYCWYFIWTIHKLNLRSRSFAMCICVLLILWYELFRCIIKHQWVLPCIQRYHRYFDICHWYLPWNINDSDHMKSYTHIRLYDIFEIKQWLHICKLFGVCLYTLCKSLWKELIITSSSHGWMLSYKTGHHVTATDLQHTLQHTCNTLQHTNTMWRSWHHHHMAARIPYRHHVTATPCNTPATPCNTLQLNGMIIMSSSHWSEDLSENMPSRDCNTLQHINNTLQHTCNTLQHTCNTLERTAKHLQGMIMTSSSYWCKDLVHDTTLRDCNTLATHLQRPATHLQHTCNTPNNVMIMTSSSHRCADLVQDTTLCDLQHTCNTPATHLQHPATHRQHTCNTLQHTKSKWWWWHRVTHHDVSYAFEKIPVHQKNKINTADSHTWWDGHIC